MLKTRGASHSTYKGNLTDRKRDAIPYVIIPWANNVLSYRKRSIVLFFKSNYWFLFDSNRSSRLETFCKKGVLRIFATSGTGVFLWILRNFKNIFYCRTPPVSASVKTWAINPFLVTVPIVYSLKTLDHEDKRNRKILYLDLFDT